MNPPDKSAGKSAALLTGANALEFYLREIRGNVKIMKGQADMMETLLLELEKLHAEQIASARCESTSKADAICR